MAGLKFAGKKFPTELHTVLISKIIKTGPARSEHNESKLRKVQGSGVGPRPDPGSILTFKRLKRMFRRKTILDLVVMDIRRFQL